MAKKTTEKDVLIVRDEKTGEISVVAGLNADGSPKRTPAKAENAQSFLQFDRHGDEQQWLVECRGYGDDSSAEEIDGKKVRVVGID